MILIEYGLTRFSSDGGEIIMAPASWSGHWQSVTQRGAGKPRATDVCECEIGMKKELLSLIGPRGAFFSTKLRYDVTIRKVNY